MRATKYSRRVSLGRTSAVLNAAQCGRMQHRSLTSLFSYRVLWTRGPAPTRPREQQNLVRNNASRKKDVDTNSVTQWHQWPDCRGRVPVTCLPACGPVDPFPRPPLLMERTVDCVCLEVNSSSRTLAHAHRARRGHPPHQAPPGFPERRSALARQGHRVRPARRQAR